MAHRRALSSRHINMAKVELDSPPLTPPLAMINSFHYTTAPTPKRKQYWQRTTFLALFALIAISVYVLLLSQPVLRPISFLDATRPHADDAAQGARWSPEAFRAALKYKKPTVATVDVHFSVVSHLPARYRGRRRRCVRRFTRWACCTFWTFRVWAEWQEAYEDAGVEKENCQDQHASQGCQP